MILTKEEYSKEEYARALRELATLDKAPQSSAESPAPESRPRDADSLNPFL